ncbi:GNAT family N-acetyltransferase [Bradyrhizobium sp. JYMT SZCCT0180]|uniref:GNAT family N-acetyltransferase n=1 Tax=Bradyrhizobium sp. JYMT SZCCT0180 TaxID=2807666 RepID=UPI001BA7BFD0|nr:GNAT family N-acetyltransferase [Bradyrhizobium sp. JYMT SZCCT0180]MBR1213809.1 GNAT family N-acetyltransferase [Bradyrhizobium sp. JYMT SZCCT0180]
MTDILIRDYEGSDADNLNRTAAAAFGQFRDHYNDWPAMLAGLSKTPALGTTGEVIIAELQDKFAGAVAYFGPDRPKAAFFDQSWPIIRMLIVDPAFRGRGIGHALSNECIARAKRDGAPLIALHTSPIMTVALPMYLKMGFVKAYDAPPIFGVAYAVYTKAL